MHCLHCTWDLLQISLALLFTPNWKTYGLLESQTLIFVWSISNTLVQVCHPKISHILVTSINIVHWHSLLMEEPSEMLTRISRWSRFLWTILCHNVWTELVLMWDHDVLLCSFQVKQTVSDHLQTLVWRKKHFLVLSCICTCQSLW